MSLHVKNWWICLWSSNWERYLKQTSMLPEWSCGHDQVIDSIWVVFWRLGTSCMNIRWDKRTTTYYFNRCLFVCWDLTYDIYIYIRIFMSYVFHTCIYIHNIYSIYIHNIFFQYFEVDPRLFVFADGGPYSITSTTTDFRLGAPEKERCNGFAFKKPFLFRTSQALQTRFLHMISKKRSRKSLLNITKVRGPWSEW